MNPKECVQCPTEAANNNNKEGLIAAPPFIQLSDIYEESLTRSGRMLCRGLWMTKSMLKSLKNSNTVIVPSSNF